VSWQVAAFGVLAIALTAGFAWFERTRPDARVVALVGTLAAFAALGRIAFAAVPNVKPTTDIVLIAGFALGAGPGFAVGAIAGLSSNFFFGQGPWTPWQMAGWGIAGLIGAGLGTLTTVGGGERRIGRWPLAIVCCVVGFAFTALQDAGDWVTFSAHSLAALGAYVGQGLGFDAVHAVSCLGFALAFGPALTRSVQRFARRIQVVWLPAGPAALLVAAALTAAAVATAGGAAAPAARAGGDPATYLLGAQNHDGGFGAAPGQPSAQLFAGWAALGLAAAGHDPAQITRGGSTVLDYVRAGAGTSDPGAIERTILVAVAAGTSPHDLGGHDLVTALRRHVSGNGSVSGEVNLTAFAIIALRGAGAGDAGRSEAWLERQQNGDGGFSSAGRGGTSDADDTGAVLEALAGQGGRAAAVRRRAVAYLRGHQDRDGGFGLQPGEGSNAQSTAWAIQGLDAAGVAAASLRRGGRSPVSYLRSLIGPGGAVAYARGSTQTPVWVTGEALMALAGKPLPLAAVPAAAAPGAGGTAAGAVPSATSAAGSRRRHTRVTHPRRRQSPRRAASHHPRTTAAATHGVAAGFARAAGTVTALLLAPVGLG
jgi:energy-coupling factor transport system substrate-specific component